MHTYAIEFSCNFNIIYCYFFDFYPDSSHLLFWNIYLHTHHKISENNNTLM